MATFDNTDTLEHIAAWTERKLGRALTEVEHTELRRLLRSLIKAVVMETRAL